MKALREAILRDGVAIGDEIVKVDMFLNHRLDIGLITQIGQAFHEAFADASLELILTIEASGIAAAITTAQAFGNLPVIFAKKGAARNQGDDVYQSTVYSKYRRVPVSRHRFGAKRKEIAALKNQSCRFNDAWGKPLLYDSFFAIVQ